MSQKYAVLANVDGEVRILRLTCNASQRGIRALCRQMAEKLFAGHKLEVLLIKPWFLDKLSHRSPAR